MNLLVVAGVSGIGKSTYVSSLGIRGWAALNHDDIVGHRIVSNEVEARWAAVFPPGVWPRLVPFLDYVGRLSQPVALEFGFPISLLPLLVELRDAGANIWWFDGDRQAAQQAWRDLNATRAQPYPDSAWRNYMDTVDAHWHAIEQVFGPHMIRVVEAGPRHLPNDEIDRAIGVTDA